MKNGEKVTFWAYARNWSKITNYTFWGMPGFKVHSECLYQCNEDIIQGPRSANLPKNYPKSHFFTDFHLWVIIFVFHMQKNWLKIANCTFWGMPGAQNTYISVTKIKNWVQSQQIPPKNDPKSHFFHRFSSFGYFSFYVQEIGQKSQITPCQVCLGVKNYSKCQG